MFCSKFDQLPVSKSRITLISSEHEDRNAPVKRASAERWTNVQITNSRCVSVRPAWLVCPSAVDSNWPGSGVSKFNRCRRAAADFEMLNANATQTASIYLALYEVWPLGGQAFSLILALRSHSREQNHLSQRNWKLILSQPPEFITKGHHIFVIGK